MKNLTPGLAADFACQDDSVIIYTDGDRRTFIGIISKVHGEILMPIGKKRPKWIANLVIPCQWLIEVQKTAETNSEICYAPLPRTMVKNMEFKLPNPEARRKKGKLLLIDQSIKAEIELSIRWAEKFAVHKLLKEYRRNNPET